MKIHVDLEGNAHAIQDLLLQAASYATDPVAAQVGMRLTLTSSQVKGSIIIEPADTTLPPLEDQALHELRTVWTELDFSKNRKAIIQCAAARMTERGMQYEAAKALVAHIMDNHMI